MLFSGWWTHIVMPHAAPQEFTAGSNKIYVRVLRLLRPFAAYSLGHDQTRRGRKVGQHLGVCKLGVVKSVRLWGWGDCMGDCICISDPPLAPGEQAGLLLRPSRAQVLSTCINLSCLSALYLPTPDPAPPFHSLGYKVSRMGTGSERGPAERRWRQ